MKALTAAIALISFATVMPPATVPKPAQLEPVAFAAETQTADPRQNRPSTLTVRPWHADYPHTTDIAGARVYASDPQQLLDVAWALDRLENAGLAMPGVEVWAHDDLSGCRRSVEDDTPPVGVYFQRDGVDTVFWCGTRFTLLHELAHVHDNNFLTPDQRTRFLAIRQADAWRHETWNRAAGEHFADVVAWGLHDRTIRPSRTLPNDDASLEEAFELAVSFAP